MFRLALISIRGNRKKRYSWCWIQGYILSSHYSWHFSSHYIDMSHVCWIVWTSSIHPNPRFNVESPISQHVCWEIPSTLVPSFQSGISSASEPMKGTLPFISCRCNEALMEMLHLVLGINISVTGNSQMILCNLCRYSMILSHSVHFRGKFSQGHMSPRAIFAALISVTKWAV